MSLIELQQLVEKYEKLVGTYSKEYRIIDVNNKHSQAKYIPSDQRPSYQLLKKFGGTIDPHESLSTLEKNVHSGPKVYKDIKINPFSLTKKSTDAHAVTISAARQKELQDSAKVYLNTDIISEDIYRSLWLKDHKALKLDENAICNINKEYWTNLAAGGVCVAQKLDSFCIPLQGAGNVATFQPTPAGIIESDAPSILLLSTPRLQFGGHFTLKTADYLSPAKQTENIEAMYRNVFNAARTEGYKYIAMAAVGFGSSGGKPQQYFEALMTVAKEFPDLNIIYNPNKYASDFEKVLANTEPQNICKTSMDITAFSLKHTKDGTPTALVDICDSNAVYGLCDFGGKWKEEHDLINHPKFSFLAYMTTLILNSFGINPDAFKKIITFSHVAPKAQEKANNTNTTITTLPSNAQEEQEEGPTVIVNTQEPPTPALASTDNSNTSTSDRSSTTFFTPIQEKPGTPPVTTPSPTSSLTTDQLDEIRKIKDNLEKEILSSWPYPNKDRKQIKVDALTKLMEVAEKQPLLDALDTVLSEYPQATYGYISTRTADLFNKLRESTHTQLCQI